MKKLLAYSVIGLLASFGSANAVLLVDITGIQGSNETLWKFSGSATAGTDGFFEDGTDLNNTNSWLKIGNFTTIDDLEISAVSGDASLTIAGLTRSIDLVYIDAGASNDDIGVGVDGSSNFGFSKDDVVSWLGALTVTGIDITDLNESGLPKSFIGSDFAGADLALAVNIGGQPSVSVPEPASLALFSLGLLGLRFSRKTNS